MIAKRDSLKLAKLDCRSVVVFGVPKNVSITAISRMLEPIALSSGLPLRKKPVLGIVRGGKGSKAFVRISLADESYRDAFYPLFRRVAESVGWTARTGRPLAVRCFLRKGRPEAEVAPCSSANPYGVLPGGSEEVVPDGEAAAAAPPDPIPPPFPLRPSMGKRKRRKLYNGSSTNLLRLGSLNLNGCGGTKTVELQDRIVALGLDVVAVQETHLSGSAPFPSILGYTWFGKNGERNSAKGHAEGGVGFLVRDYLAANIEKMKARSKDQLWIKLRGRRDRKDLVLGCVYMPPSSHEADLRKKAFNNTNRLISSFSESSDVMVLGDFNARPGPDSARVGCLEDRGVNQNGGLLLDLLSRRDLWSAWTCARSRPGVSPHTYERRNSEDDWTRTNLDYILVNRALRKRVSRFAVDDVGERVPSDHKLLMTELEDLNLPARREPTRPSTKWRVEKLEDEATRKAYAKAMDKFSGLVLSSGVIGGGDVEQACRKTADAFNEANREYLGEKFTAGRKTHPWYTDQIRQCVKERIKLHGDYLELRGDSQWQKYVEKRAEVNKLVRSAKRKCWNNFVESMEADLAEKPRMFWTKAKRLLKSGQNGPSIALRNDAGELVTQPDEVVEAFADHYERLGMSSTDALFDQSHFEQITKEVQAPPQPQVPALDDLDAPFSEEEVFKTIKRMKNGAGGKDQIRPQMLKAALGLGTDWGESEKGLEGHTLSLLTALGSMVLKSEKMPEDWQLGQIFNIFKKGEPEDRGNYRGITLLSVIGKMVTRVMADRLSRKAEEMGWIDEEQGGFRPGRRTEDQALILSRSLLNRRLKKKHTCVFFLDVVKAYDTVWRDGLLSKLRSLGVTGKMYGLIASMYASTRSSVVGPGGCESRSFDISEGVRQGDPLSCILFNLFFNDLITEIKESGVVRPVQTGSAVIRALLFADDVAIPCQSVSDMKKVISAVERHSTRWRWKANTTKSKLMWFHARNRDPPVDCDITLYDETIGWVDEYEYLGITFTPDLSWDKHVDKICAAAKNRARTWSQLLSMPQLHRSARVLFYTSMIRPLLEYGCAVWTPNSSQSKKLEAVQMECLRKVIPCTQATPSWPIRNELRIPRLSTRRTKLLLRYWFDLNAVYDEGRLVRRVAAFNIIPISRGPAPAGTNKTLGIEAFKAFDLDEAIWREKIRESGFERLEDGVPVPKELHPVWKDFDKALREASEKLEAKDCSSELGVMSRVYDSFVDRSANYLKSNSFGALLKFRFRSGANSLGKRYVNGRLVSAPCPSCNGKETLKHFLEDCEASAGERAELQKHDPFSNPARDFVTTLLQDFQPRPRKKDKSNLAARVVEEMDPTEKLSQQFLVSCWQKRGVALGLRSETPASGAPTGATRACAQQQGEVWQPRLERFFARAASQDNAHATHSGGFGARAPVPSSSRLRDGVNGNQSSAMA